MPEYRRLYFSGGTYFFTVNLLDRSRDLLTKHIDLLRQAYRTVQAELPFETFAIVVLPDHLHCVWKLPEDDADFSTRWKKIKRNFSYSLPLTEDASVKRRSQERGIWQRRFWEHLIRDDEDLNRHVDYVHFNPVKHEYVSSPDDWPYSTWHRWKKDFEKPLNPTAEQIGGFHPPYE